MIYLVIGSYVMAAGNVVISTTPGRETHRNTHLIAACLFMLLADAIS